MSNEPQAAECCMHYPVTLSDGAHRCETCGKVWKPREPQAALTDLDQCVRELRIQGSYLSVKTADRIVTALTAAREALARADSTILMRNKEIHDLALDICKYGSEIVQLTKARDAARAEAARKDAVVEAARRYVSCEDNTLNPLYQALAALAATQALGGTFQQHVQAWCVETFGPTTATDVTERNWRFLEEALELVQSLGGLEPEVRRLAAYVFGRPPGEPAQEVGGTMIALAALCAARGIDLQSEAEREYTRINQPEMVEKIRRKHAAKPHASPLPGDYHYPATDPQAPAGGGG